MLAYVLLGLQLLLMLYFSFFAFYNFYYGIACLFKPKLKRVKPSGKKVAVVIVSYNEKEVMETTIKACEKLTYKNKVIIVGDDSNDGETAGLLRDIADKKGCVQVRGASIDPRAKVFESEKFVLYHRPHGHDAKGGHLKELEKYLQAKGFDYMYLLDADWWPQKDAIERCLEVLEAEDTAAFVQTRRHSYHGKKSFLQRCLSINEDGSSLVDLAGRQVVRDPILFGGCSTMFRLKDMYDVGGFPKNHLTEDIDLTNRYYLQGYKAIYLDTVANEGEVPPHYHAYTKQQEHWAAGAARTFRDYFWPIIFNKRMRLHEKLAMMRQNSFYTTAVGINFSILLAFATVLMMLSNTDFFQAALYQYYLKQIAVPYNTIMIVALGSNFLHPIITTIKRKKYVNLMFIPYATWASWSILHTYFWANIQGFFGLKLEWFHTPKTNKKNVKVKVKRAHGMRLINLMTLIALLWLYWMEWTMLGWLDVYAFFWIPALVTGTFLS